ncbi:unnamed protein product [Mytilus edulis]|uniref:Reverse transcriptase domain-containing protein n=1 Tax=Mytilus edulis TaxID=6550 RepID=A0A8S3U7D1_MYTED|nr:unnamed protein product [Mytilus edulis]
MNNCVPTVRDPQQCHVNTRTPMYVNPPPRFDNRQGYNPYLDTGAFYNPRHIELYPNVQPHMSNPGIAMPQPQLSRVTPSRKEKEPDIFNGSKTEWVDYIVHFEQVAAWNRWSDSEKAQQLSMCLRGPAQKILSDLTLGQLSDYTSIKSALAQRFHPRESEVAYRCEFRNLKRQKDETVADYGYRLRRSAQKAYPALKCSDIEPTVIDQYIHGLNNHELKKHVQFHHPQTLIQAIAFASEFEAFLGSSDRIFKPEGTDSKQSDFKIQALTCKEENSKPEGVTMKDISKLLDEKLEKLFNKDNRVPENQPPKRFEANPHQNNNDSQKRYGSRNREIRSTGSCLNVEVEINELKCKLLVDTGSPVCILSEQLFKKLNKGTSLLTKSSTSVHTADGTALDIKGKIDIKLKIGKLCLDQELIVAKIDNLSGILGMNFLSKHDVEIHIGKEVLVIKGEKIKFKKETSKVCAKVRLIDKVSIPPNSELLVESFIDGHIDNKSGLVESTDFVKQKGLMLAKSLVDTDKKCSLLLLNMNQKTVKLNENTVVALVSDVDTLEGQNETDSLESERQVLPEHLQHLVDSTSDKLTEIEKVKLTNLIHEYSSVFAEPGKALGQTDLATHKIDTGDHAPIKIPARRIPLAKKEVVDKELEKMLNDGQIEPKGLTRLPKKMRTPPKPDDTFEALSGSSWFHVVDMQTGYWQIRMDKTDQHKTAFATHRGLFEFKVMPMGLANSAATFERLVEMVLGNLNWKKCLCYLDDIIIFGRDFETALQNLKEVFQRLKMANLKLKAKKCHLFQSKVTYLGHVVSAQGIECDPKKIEDVKNWTVPKNVKNIKSFLGFTGYYRKFIPHFSEVAAPLNRLTRKGVKFTWDEKCKNSFDQLKNALTTAPILSLPTSDGNFILDTDASNVGVGAVLSQMQNDEERVIAYSSRALSSSQQNYCTTKRELLATDHAPLYWLKNFKNPQGMLARWLSILDTYDFEIQHRVGIKHQNADALSRHPKLKCPNGNCSDCSVLEPKLTESDSKVKICPISATDNDDSADVNEECALEPNWLQNWNKKDLEEYQSIDKSVGPVRQMKVDYIEKPKRDKIRHLNTEGHFLWTQWDLLEIHNGLLYRRIDNKLGQSILQLVAPNQIRDFIFKEVHENRIGGHFGRDKTLESIKRRFYWPGLTETVKRWCRTCDICARGKPGPGQGKSSLKQFKVTAPMQCVAVVTST